MKRRSTLVIPKLPPFGGALGLERLDFYCVNVSNLANASLS